MVEYGAWELRWLLVLDEDSDGVVDLIPGSLPGDDDDVYSSYPLSSSFPSLLTPPSTRKQIEIEARASFHARQLAMLPSSLHHEALDSALVTKSRIDVVVRIEGEQRASCPLARVSFERRPDDELTFIESSVTRLPRDKLPVTCAAFRQPTFANLPDFVRDCRQAYSEPWRRRKLLTEEFQKSFAVLDVDPVDYASLQLAVQVALPDGRKRIILVDVAFANSDFPAKPPILTIRDYREKNAKKELDRNNYLYSPRWDPTRVASELVDHACQQVSVVYGRPPATTTAPLPL